MPGTPGHSGGPRQGVQGAGYTNRSDLIAGTRSAASVASSAAAMPGGATGAPSVAIPLDAPSTRPGEHVMTGVAAGPGPGPREAGLVPAGVNPNDVLEQLRAIYSVDPNPDLAALIERTVAGDYRLGGQFT